MLDEVLPAKGAMSVNYGTNRVRFPAPVPSGSRVRGRFRVLDVQDTELGARANIEAVVEREGSDRPVCVAELIVLTVS
jgi:acyl dehydratase